MAYHEGWINSLKKPDTAGSLSYRNHNPGNLRFSTFQVGTKDGFAVFNSDMDGIMALKYDIIKKAKGETVTGLTGNSTLSDLIYKYAPPADHNDTANYLAEIILMSGLSATTKLSEFLN